MDENEDRVPAEAETRRKVLTTQAVVLWAEGRREESILLIGEASLIKPGVLAALFGLSQFIKGSLEVITGGPVGRLLLGPRYAVGPGQDSADVQFAARLVESMINDGGKPAFGMWQDYVKGDRAREVAVVSVMLGMAVDHVAQGREAIRRRGTGGGV